MIIKLSFFQYATLEHILGPEVQYATVGSMNAIVFERGGERIFFVPSLEVQ